MFIFVTLLGIFIVVIFEQFWKAYSPILATLSGIVILSAKEQLLKAYAGIVVASVIVMLFIVFGIK